MPMDDELGGCMEPRMGERKGTAWTDAVERQDDWREMAEEEDEMMDGAAEDGREMGVRGLGKGDDILL